MGMRRGGEVTRQFGRLTLEDEEEDGADEGGDAETEDVTSLLARKDTEYIRAISSPAQLATKIPMQTPTRWDLHWDSRAVGWCGGGVLVDALT
eukprot:2347640-Pyramimonas_sp.AAC.1